MKKQMLKEKQKTCNKSNANNVGAILVSARKNKIIANAVGVAPLGDPHFERNSKKTSKAYLNPNYKFQTLTSNVRGITLIALIITIIVMLILVGVTINVALNGGLFSKAREARENTEIARDGELQLSEGKINVDDKVYNSVEEYIEIGGIDLVKPTNSDIGKYVEYGIDLNGNGNKKDDWRVFYVDDNGNTFIIAADYVVGDKCSEVKTAIETNSQMFESRVTGGYDKFCYVFSNKTNYNCYDGHNTTVENENTISKKQCSYPELFMATGYYCSDHVGADGKNENINSRYVSTLLCSDNWNPLVDKKYGASYAIGGPTIEMWVASWNEKYGKDKDKYGITLYANGNNNDTSETGYYIGNSESTTDSYCSVSRCSNGTNDTLYFPHDSANLDSDGDGEADGACSGYWLSSPSARGNDYVMHVQWCWVITDTYPDVSGFDMQGLRPIVCLPYGVKLAENQNF